MPSTPTGVRSPAADEAVEAEAARQRAAELERREAELREREAEIARREQLAARERELAERERRIAEREREVASASSAPAPRPAGATGTAVESTKAPVEASPGPMPEPERAILVEPEASADRAADEEPWNESWRNRGRDRQADDAARSEDTAPSEEVGAVERRAALERLRAGTTFEVELQETLSSGTSRVGDTFRTTLVEDVRDADGALVVPAGSVLWGDVIDARPLRRVGGQATLALEFRRLELPTGETVELRARFVELGRNQKKDKLKIAGAAIAGAILGRILGDGEAAAVGAAVGAAAGTAAVMRSEGTEVELPEGTVVALELQEVVTVTTRYGDPLR